MIKFDRDSAKAASNLRKHGVSFEEAQSVFYDEFAIQFYDEPHFSGEEGFLMPGMSSGAHLLLVCHCERDSGGVIRIISAFKGMASEAGVPYQSLINLYLRDCVMKHRTVQIAWPSSKA